MLNAIGLQNVGVDVFSEREAAAVAGTITAVVANVFGETEADYGRGAKLDRAEGMAAVELNVSCPNTEAGACSSATTPMLSAG